MMKRWIPLGVVAVTLIGIIIGTIPRNKSSFDLVRFGQIPVLHEGRVKPVDSVARGLLLAARGKQIVTTGNTTLQPTEWLLETAVNPAKADHLPVFAVQNSVILGMLGKPTETKLYLSFADFVPYLDRIEQETAQISQIPAKDRTPYQRDIMALKTVLVNYTQLKNTFQPEGVREFALYTRRFVEQAPASRDALRRHPERPGSDPELAGPLNEIMLYFRQFRYIGEAALFRLCPPEPKSGQWRTLGDGYLLMLSEQDPHPAAPLISDIVTAYEKGDSAQFNSRVGDYHRLLNQKWPELMPKVKAEFYVNHAQFFYVAMVIYLAVVAAIFISWLIPGTTVYRSGNALLWLGYMIHTGSILARMWIQGRPPVTNLYTSSVFVGWVAIGLGILLERMYKNGFGAIVSGIIGFCTLIIAHHLALQGDTLGVMQAVLDSNFWLATHVVTICIGYGATFLAGFLAIVLVIRGVFTRTLTSDMRESTLRMIYGIICFGLLFSFVGTVL
ncbi:hypothetical protein EBR96_07950, partial [bacterium]|nr:hypothetical protein [bacterium]